MKKLSLLFAVLAFCIFLSLTSLAASTVYVDGIGTDENCYATLKLAVAAVDNGGTVILTADHSTDPKNVTLLASKDVTITSEDGTETLTLTRALRLGGNTTFKNITIKNACSTGTDYIYCCGHNLVIGEGVTTQANASTSRYLSIMVGDMSTTCTVDNTVNVKSGTWRDVFTGGNTDKGGCNGNPTVNIYDGVVISSEVLLGGNTAGATMNVNATVNIYGGTVTTGIRKTTSAPVTTCTVNLYGGTKVGKISVPVTVNLEKGGSVTITNENGQEVTRVTRDGDTVVQTGTVYSVPFVYLDGTGATEGMYTDFKKAVSSLLNGGTVIVTGDTTVGTGDTSASDGVTLDAVGYKVTVTGEDNAVLTMTRSLTLRSELEFNNITIHSTSTSNGRILCQGNTLTIGDGVVIEPSGNNLYPSIIGGHSSTTNYNSELIVKSGTWQHICGGNVSGTFNGDSTVTVSNATVIGTLTAGSLAGTFTGTANLTLDLKGNKTVTAKTFGEITEILVDDDWKAVKTGNTYKEEMLTYSTVYVDGTGETEGAYTTFDEAFGHLAPEGGTIIVSGDTQFGTTGTGGGIVLSDYKTFTGKITITSESGARLIFARSLRLNTALEFEDIHIHSIIPSGNGGVNNILCHGNTLTIGAGVTVTKDDGTIYPAIIGGEDANTTYDSHLIIGGGIWQNIWGGGFDHTFSGKSTVEVSNATVIGTLTAGSRSGTFSGTGTLTLDLRGGKTVTAGTFEDPAFLVDDGYEAVLTGNTYAQALLTAGVEVAVSGTDAFIDAEERGNLRTIVTVTVPTGKTVTEYGVYYIPLRVFNGDNKALTNVVDIRTEGALQDGDQFSADLMQIPAEFCDETILVIPFVIVAGENVSISPVSMSVNGIVNG